MANLARGLSEKGLNVDLVLVKGGGIYLKDVPSQVHVVNFGLKRVITSLPDLISYLREKKPDVMLSAIEHLNVLALCAAKLARVNTRMIATVHNTLSQAEGVSPIRGFVMPILVRKIYPWADEIIVVSKAAREDFLQLTNINSTKVHVIYNPVVTPELFLKAKENITHPWFAPGEPPVILGAGRLSRQKDFATLIRAFSRLRQQCSARLVIIGEGEERESLQSLVRQLSLQNHVDLTGFVDNPYALMARASAFVLSSAWEGLPTVLIEALALNVPIVSTDCPSGPREILNNGKYGKLVSVGDDMALAEGIMECLSTQHKPITSDAWRPFELKRIIEQYIHVLLGGSVA